MEVRELPAVAQDGRGPRAAPNFAGLWEVDVKDEGANELVWNPDPQRLPNLRDVEYLFDGLERRITVITLAARTPAAAEALLLSVAGAFGVPPLRQLEIDEAVHALICQAVAACVGTELAGRKVAVVPDSGGGLQLQVECGDFDAGAPAAADFENELARALAIGLPLPRAPQASGAAAGGLLSWWRRRRRPEEPAADGSAESTKLVGGLRIAELLATQEVWLVDALEPEERAEASRDVARAVSSAQRAVLEDASAALLVPLPVRRGPPHNTLMAAAAQGALAVLVDVLIGGRMLSGHGLHTVELRGCRGVAVTFKREGQCSVM